MSKKNKLLDVVVIGAGPYGLSIASYLQSKGLNYLVLGKPFEFWKENMPDNMILRSSIDWHIDPLGECSYRRFLNEQKTVSSYASKATFLEYGSWFLSRKRLIIVEEYVSKLSRRGSENFYLSTDKGSVFSSKNVVIAIGAKNFYHIPESISSVIPHNYFRHTFETNELENFKNKKVLVIGGRQSAFEWSALLVESGCPKVYLSFPHAKPEFTKSDWTWAEGLLSKYLEIPGWFMDLSQDKKRIIQERFWQEGRQKLEPWLGERITNKEIDIFENTTILRCKISNSNRLIVSLSSNQEIEVDSVILATGYKTNINNIPFLEDSDLIKKIETNKGVPKLDYEFQSSEPGLYFSGFATTQQQGPFFGFLIGTNTCSRIIGDSVVHRVYSSI